uniref:Uncharacterized protein n=1 Tax=Candidatus Kentrum sp. LPFa TaxID=2126335 RepID=A0A450WIV1_9GAMM|nr:MAG: hypothetical protein BECKLPF1236A_GA0070988_101584 [Candidatus Kentron sp. LPFa]
MQIKTILNRVQKFNSFVYGKVCWAEGEREAAIDVELRPRKNSRPICPKCGHPTEDPDTTNSRYKDSNLFRCGGSRYFLSSGYAGLGFALSSQGWLVKSSH